MLKSLVKKALARLGYQVIRIDRSLGEQVVRFDNFADLARAYEFLLDRMDGVRIPSSSIRSALLARLLGTLPGEAYAIVHALAQTRDVPGDVCEFGVAQGETSALIATEIAGAGAKRLHLFDSFEGLPPPGEKDALKDDIFHLGSIDAYAGTMSCPEDMVRARLHAVSFPVAKYVVHAGLIEDVLHAGENLPSQVSFAYVDFDFYEPIRHALEFLHSVTSPGSIIIVDDYDFFSTGAKTAVDEWLVDKNAAGAVYKCEVADTRLGYFAVITRVAQ